MARREPYASEEEFKKRVVHYPDVPREDHLEKYRKTLEKIGK